MPLLLSASDGYYSMKVAMVKKKHTKYARSGLLFLFFPIYNSTKLMSRLETFDIIIHLSQLDLIVLYN